MTCLAGAAVAVEAVLFAPGQSLSLEPRDQRPGDLIGGEPYFGTFGHCFQMVLILRAV